MGEAVTYESISREESWAVFDDAAMRMLGMSGDEVVNRWENGGFEGQRTPELMRVLMLRPGGR